MQRHGDHEESAGVQSFADAQEWRMNKTIRTWREHTTNTSTHRQQQQKLCIACTVTRRPGFFIWNMFIIMFLICSLAFCTFVVAIDKPENRLQLSFTLVLTTIAFKFVANQTIPRISYLTFLDKYILTSMAIMCCICIWHSIVNLLPEYTNTHIQSVDKIMLCALASVYVAFHLIFILCIICRVVAGKKRRWRVFNVFPSRHKIKKHDSKQRASPVEGYVNQGMNQQHTMHGDDTNYWEASLSELHDDEPTFQSSRNEPMLIEPFCPYSGNQITIG